MEKFSNHLIHESSPYLLQHAHNPVEWYPWGQEALNKAKELDRPILVSIGYAACHWCHVMERESFENEEVAEYMNEHFINIKIDREERPDLDHIYMDAVQAIAGSGGWPLNVFLTTDAKPFYGGTYFPPRKAFNRPSWQDVLTNISEAWKNKKEELTEQAENLTKHINLSSSLVGKNKATPLTGDEPLFSSGQCETIAENILKAADQVDGGFGAAPKFPQTFTIQYLLAYGHFFSHDKALAQAELSLQKMLNGGIYDQLAGGLSRYSTDSHWLAPHFEKMLYDNALLVSVLADAYQITGKQVYADAIHKTLRFFIAEMKHSEGGFYAALDADSEGEEGKFYVWDKSAIDSILGDGSDLYCKWFGATEEGNWEGKNILHIAREKDEFAAENGLTTTAFDELIEEANKKLLEKRNKRIRPQTDDKIILGWNALLLTAFCKASAALKNEDYRSEAESLFEFIIDKFSEGSTVRFHTYKNDKAKHPAFLDDYAFLIQACIYLQEISSEQKYLLKAKELTEHVIAHFEDAESGFFYYTGVDQTDVITRKMEFYDGAIPSGNSIMADNLFYLSTVFEKTDWQEKALGLMRGFMDAVLKYPTSFAIWASLILKQVIGINEIALSGKAGFDEMRKDILAMYVPNKIFQSSQWEEDFPLLKNKDYGPEPLIYLCRNYTCLAPVNSTRALKLLLQSDFINNKVHNI